MERSPEYGSGSHGKRLIVDPNIVLGAEMARPGIPVYLESSESVRPEFLVLVQGPGHLVLVTH